MAKKVKAIIKLQIPAGKANPAPPVGSALGQHGVNIMQFCKEYNDRTSSQAGSIIPAEITVFEDRSYTFITKMPPAADLIKKTLTLKQLLEIADVKAKDLNSTSIEGAEQIIAGTARSMGIEVE